MPIGSGMKRVDNHAEEQKVAMTSQLHKQTNAAYADYMDLHDMQKADLDRSMVQLGESFDDEEKRLANDSDGFFEQEFVENDRQRGLDHLAKIQKIVEKQESVYRNIMAKVVEGEAQPKVRKERLDPTDDVGDSGNMYRKKDHASLRVANGCVVANTLLRKQARYDKFHHNRFLIAMADNEKVEALKATHAEAERLAERRQHELVEKQFHKTLAAQQKRNEQQKMLKEIQRFQDHQFELLQLKHHPEAVSTHKLLPPVVHPKTPQTAPGRSSLGSSRSEPKLSRSMMQDPIYRDMQQSHKLFASTLDKWRSFEADNEKRTEAYWRKMLQGERKKHEKKESPLGTLRRRVTEITAVRKFVQQAQKSIDGMEVGELGPLDTVDFLSEAIDATTPMAFPSPMSGDPSVRSQYAERLEKVRFFHEDKDRMALEKRERDVNKLEEKLMRSKEYQQQKAAKAQESMRAWQKKNMQTTMRRDRLASQNDDDFYEKMESKLQMIGDKNARMDQDRKEYFGTRTQVQQSVKEAAKNNIAETRKMFEERQAEKHEQSFLRLDERMQANESRATSSTQDIAREKCELKRTYESQSSLEAQKEINKKLSRHEEAKKRVMKPMSTKEAIMKQRLIKKDKAAQGRKASFSELELPPELTLPSHLFLSPTSGRQQLSPEALEPPGSARSSDVKPEWVDLELQTRETRAKSIGLLSASGSAGSPGLSSPVYLSSPAFQHLQSTGGSSRRSTQLSESDSDDGENFLQDLQGRSSRWLKDIRKKADVIG